MELLLIEKRNSQKYIYIYIYCIFWCHRLYIKKYYKHLFIKLLRCTNYIHCYINCKTFVLKFYNNCSSFIFYLGLYIVKKKKKKSISQNLGLSSFWGPRAIASLASRVEPALIISYSNYELSIICYSLKILLTV